MNSTTSIFTRYFMALVLGAAVLVGGLALVSVQAHAQDGSVAPVLSNIASTTTDTGATITWTSDQAGTAQVFYGPTTGYGAMSTLDNTASTTNHTSFLGGLTANTLYHFVVVTGNASGTVATSSDMTFMTTNTTASTTTPVASSTAPVLSMITATPTQNGATLTWTTDQNANSQVMYGLTSGYGNTTTLDTNNVMSHSVMLTGLAANTMYHFQVWSMASGTAMTSSSTDMTFTTLMGSTTDTTGLQAQIDALKARVSALEAALAAWMSGGTGGGTGTTTPPTNTGSGTIDTNGSFITAGGAMDLSGRNFGHEENVTVTLNGATIAVAHADGGGNFSTGSFNAPSTPGSYTFVFKGQNSGDIASTNITVH